MDEQARELKAGLWAGGLAALLGLLVVILLLAAVLRPARRDEAAATAGGGAQSELELFYAELRENPPDYFSGKLPAPDDGTVLELDVKYHTNNYGGVATDLMSIALAPPEGESGPPQYEQQAFDKQITTNPNTGATFMKRDIDAITAQKLTPGAADPLAGFALRDAAPQLFSAPVADWDYSRRHLAHYLTVRAADFPPFSLGYAALSGAYSANFSTWLGRDSSVPAAAFYALARIHFKAEYEASAADNPRAAAAASLLHGECCRLLGLPDEAQAAYSAASASGGADAAQAEVIPQLLEYARSGDFNLHRAEVSGIPRPPVGWYLDQALPAINAELQVTRSQWTPEALGAESPDAIVQHILSGI